MSTGIYKITNKINNKNYIGKSKNIEQRWKQHIYEAKQGSTRALCRALNKYGQANFNFEIIESISLEEYDTLSNEREKYWISYYNSFSDQGYNMTEGGDGGHPKRIYIGGFGDSALATEKEVKEIRTAYKNIEPRHEVYERYKDHITFNAFERIWLNKSWVGIMPEVYTRENAEAHKHTKKPANTNNAKLTKDQVFEIRKRYDNGQRSSLLAKEYNVSQVTISRIGLRQTWKNI